MAKSTSKSTEKFYKLSDETQQQFYSIYNKNMRSVDIGFLFVGCENQKQLINITKIPDKFAFITNKALMVSINEDLLNVFDEESVSILIEQEADKILVDMESGKVKIIKPDLSTFSSLISKYGIDKIARANKVEELYQQQVKDGKEEFTF